MIYTNDDLSFEHQNINRSRFMSIEYENRWVI